MLVQFLASGLAILFIIKTISDFKKKKVGVKNFLFWTFVWSAILIFAFLPQVVEPLRKLLGVSRGVDVAVYFSIIFIFYILFEIVKKVTKIEQEITKIVREIAVNNRSKSNP